MVGDKLPIEPMDDVELRELLLEAEIDVDPEVFARMLVAAQPIRGMLRSTGADRRRMILRRTAMTEGWSAPDDPRAERVAPSSPRRARPTPPELVAGPRPTLRHLLDRIAAIYGAALAGLFAMMIWMGGSVRGVAMALAAVAVALLLLAVTGWRPPRRGTKEPERDGVGTVVVMVLLVVTGVVPLMAFSVLMVFSPAAWAEGGVTWVMQAVGVITLYVVGSHVRAMRRS